MSVLRLVCWEVADGQSNMAADEALLASAGAGIASLRFYGWTEATASLGYFQKHAAVRAKPTLTLLPWVRRPSGGMTLVHHHEITYALALSAGPTWQPIGQSWLIRMHEVIADALRAFGVKATLCSEPNPSDDPLCFLHHTPGDLLIAGHKVVGSAQRKGRAALMQHGSILLRQSPHTPELPGIAELTNIHIAPKALVEAIQRTLARRLGWSFVSAPWTDEERRVRQELLLSRYRSSAWNERR